MIFKLCFSKNCKIKFPDIKYHPKTYKNSSKFFLFEIKISEMMVCIICTFINVLVWFKAIFLISFRPLLKARGEATNKI